MTNYETTSKTWRVNCKGGMMTEETVIAIQGMGEMTMIVDMMGE